MEEKKSMQEVLRENRNKKFYEKLERNKKAEREARKEEALAIFILGFIVIVTLLLIVRTEKYNHDNGICIDYHGESYYCESGEFVR